MICNYDKINYHNIKIVDGFIDNENFKNSYAILLDNKIYLHYVHYIKNDNYLEPTRKKDITGKPNRDLLYKYADKLLLEKYNTRLSRFIKLKEDPIFIIDLIKYINDEELLDLLYLDSKYKRIFIFNENFYNKLNPNKSRINKNCEIIIYTNDDNITWTNEKSRFILKKSKFINKALSNK